MYIFGYKTTVFIQNLYILVKYFGKNFIFSVKSTIFFLVFIFWVQNLDPKFVHFSLAKTSFLTQKVQKMYIFGYIYTFYPKFVHFSEIFWQKRHL